MSIDEKDLAPESGSRQPLIDGSAETVAQQIDLAESAQTEALLTAQATKEVVSLEIATEESEARQVPFYKKRAAKMFAGITAVAVVGVGTFTLGRGGASESETNEAPVATEVVVPAAPNNVVVTEPTPEVTSIPVTEKTVVVETSPEVVPAKTTPAGEPEITIAEAETTSPEAINPLNNAIQVETPLGTTIEVPKITSNDPQEMMNQALTLLSCYESLNSEACLGYLTSETDIQDIFISGTESTRADFEREHLAGTPRSDQVGVIYRLTGGFSVDNMGNEILITPDTDTFLESCTGYIKDWGFDEAFEHTDSTILNGDLVVRNRSKLNQIAFAPVGDGTYQISGIRIEPTNFESDFSSC